LVEELRVRKEVIEHHEPQTVNVLREEVDITRVAKNENVAPSDRKG
jgi:stress response protein YsnF